MSHGTSFQYFFLTMSDGLKLDPFALWAIEPTASLPQASHGNAGHVCRGLCRVAAVLWHWHFYRLWWVSAFYIAPIQRGNVTQPEIESKNRVKWTIPKTNITFLHTSLDVKMFRCSRTCRIDSDHGARRCLTWHKSRSELPSGRWSISVVKFKPSGYSMGQI